MTIRSRVNFKALVSRLQRILLYASWLMEAMIGDVPSARKISSMPCSSASSLNPSAAWRVQASMSVGVVNITVSDFLRKFRISFARLKSLSLLFLINWSRSITSCDNSFLASISLVGAMISVTGVRISWAILVKNSISASARSFSFS